uniref:(California timema) hypothetical protein n=1 Tax=Timema californicum TaxID=61474 RepID=A0A7R9J5G8_TIMCA|nr:unnamed protein product [Timema californicum]
MDVILAIYWVAGDGKIEVRISAEYKSELGCCLKRYCIRIVYGPYPVIFVDDERGEVLLHFIFKN